MQVTERKQEDEQRVDDDAKQWLERSLQSGVSALGEWLEQSGRQGAAMQEAGGLYGGLQEITRELPGKWAELPEVTLKLRAECGKLSQSQHVGLIGRLLRRNPLKHYVHAYHAVRCNIDEIVIQLREERETLEVGGTKIRRLNEAVTEERLRLQSAITFGLQLLEILEDETVKPENVLRQDVLKREQRRTAALIQTMEETVKQLHKVAEITEGMEADNGKLTDSVNNVIDKTSTLVTLSAMIAMSLADRESSLSVMGAETGVVEETARLLAGVTGQTEELLTRPAASLAAANRAIGELLAAIDASGRTCFQIVAGHREDREAVGKLCKEIQGLASFPE